MVPAAVRLGCRLDDTKAFELLETLREQGTGESGRALQDFAEASAAKVQVADDQRCPAFGEDLGAARDGAILAVRPHDASIAHAPPIVKYRFLTLLPRSQVVECGLSNGEEPDHDDTRDRGGWMRQQAANSAKDQRFSRGADQRRPRRLRHYSCRMERCNRPASAPDRPLYRDNRCNRGGAFRPRPRSGNLN